MVYFGYFIILYWFCLISPFLYKFLVCCIQTHETNFLLYIFLMFFKLPFMLGSNAFSPGLIWNQNIKKQDPVERKYLQMKLYLYTQYPRVYLKKSKIKNNKKLKEIKERSDPSQSQKNLFGVMRALRCLYLPTKNAICTSRLIFGKRPFSSYSFRICQLIHNFTNLIFCDVTLLFFCLLLTSFISSSPFVSVQI